MHWVVWLVDHVVQLYGNTQESLVRLMKYADSQIQTSDCCVCIEHMTVYEVSVLTVYKTPRKLLPILGLCK